MPPNPPRTNCLAWEYLLHLALRHRHTVPVCEGDSNAKCKLAKCWLQHGCATLLDSAASRCSQRGKSQETIKFKCIIAVVRKNLIHDGIVPWSTSSSTVIQYVQAADYGGRLLKLLARIFHTQDMT
eukprot:1717410-Amphidinium_carterae.1